jgi:hypothetical protein
VIKPVMSEEDLRNCAAVSVSTPRTTAVLQRPAAPVALEKSAPAQPRSECVIKPVMSDEDLRACAVRR